MTHQTTAADLLARLRRETSGVRGMRLNDDERELMEQAAAEIERMHGIVDATPVTADAAKGFTRAELRGVQRLADRIKFDLHVTPATQWTATWRRRQEMALAVILERIKDGR